LSRWSAGELARRIGATVEGAASISVDTVTTDSRTSPEGSVFFALEGVRVSGVDFVPEAFGSGCSVVVVPRSWKGEIPEGRAALRVGHPLEALGSLARSVRAEWTNPVIAITGSVGKTSVKEMTAHVLEDKGGPLLRSPGNFNTVEGLARALLSVPDPPRLAVLEVGASKPGEIARLAGIVRPTSGAVTNVSAAHLSGFGSLEEVRKEKLELLRAVPEGGLSIVDGDDLELVRACRGMRGRVMRVGFGESNDLRAVLEGASALGGMRFRIEGGPRGELAVPGAHQVKNALFALAFASAYGASLPEGLASLAEFRGVPGRLSISKALGATIADDTYNANPASMLAALAWLGGMPAKRKAVILGDMLELGADSPRFHRELGRQVATLAPDLAVFVGEESRVSLEEVAKAGESARELYHVPSSDEAARLLCDWVRKGDLVLVKGSRGMRMERVVVALSGRVEGDAV
jgi:UDP-N-acetylmuramoyl-tripeptide--D-alanyl-D-alanine ligase